MGQKLFDISWLNESKLVINVVIYQFLNVFLDKTACYGFTKKILIVLLPLFVALSVNFIVPFRPRY